MDIPKWKFISLSDLLSCGSTPLKSQIHETAFTVEKGVRFNLHPHILLSFLLPYQFRLMGHVVAGIAVGIHEQLGVGVDGDEGLEVAVASDQVHYVLHLNLRVS